MNIDKEMLLIQKMDPKCHTQSQIIWIWSFKPNLWVSHTDDHGLIHFRLLSRRRQPNDLVPEGSFKWSSQLHC